MPRFNEMPPTATTWPAQVAKIATELKAMQERATQARRDLNALVGDDSPGERSGILLALQKADQAEMTAAARSGKTIPARRPATEQHALNVEAARAASTAIEGAELQLGNELQAALNEHGPAIDAAVTAEVEATADAYADAVDRLEAARLSAIQAVSTITFVDRARRAKPSSYLNFVAAMSPEIAGNRASFGAGNFDQITAALRGEAAHYKAAATSSATTAAAA